MVIGLFTDSYVPQINGVATSVYTLKQELEHLGHTVYVFTTTDPDADSSAERSDNVFRMRSVPVMSERRLGVGYSPRMYQWVRHLGLDIVHTNSEFSLGFFGSQVAAILKIPHIHTYHTIWEEYTHFIVGKAGFLDPVAKRVIRDASTAYCNSADWLIVPTRKVSQLLRKYGVYRPISIIPTGIELEQFTPTEHYDDERSQLRSELNFKPDDYVLTYVGRVSEEKNIGHLLSLLASWMKRHSEAQFLCVGDGSARPALEKQISDLGIEAQCRFVGKQPWVEIACWYHVGDCFVSASQSETQGLTYVEALAAGLPVIARSDAALDGVVDNGRNGWQWEDQTELEQALDTCRADNGVLRQSALESAACFSTERFAGSVYALYEKAYQAAAVRPVRRSRRRYPAALSGPAVHSRLRRGRRFRGRGRLSNGGLRLRARTGETVRQLNRKARGSITQLQHVAGLGRDRAVLSVHVLNKRYREMVSKYRPGSRQATYIGEGDTDRPRCQNSSKPDQ